MNLARFLIPIWLFVVYLIGSIVAIVFNSPSSGHLRIRRFARASNFWTGNATPRMIIAATPETMNHLELQGFISCQGGWTTATHLEVINPMAAPVTIYLNTNSIFQCLEHFHPFFSSLPFVFCEKQERSDDRQNIRGKF